MCVDATSGCPAKPMNLLDLPNEILWSIVRYMSMIETFHAFVGISERLDQLVLHPISTRTLDMTCLRLALLPERIYSLDRSTLQAICRNVLPRISHHITELIFDQFSIGAVIHAAEYPELRSLSIIDISDPILLDTIARKTALGSLPAERCSNRHQCFQISQPQAPVYWAHFSRTRSLV